MSRSVNPNAQVVHGGIAGRQSERGPGLAGGFGVASSLAVDTAQLEVGFGVVGGHAREALPIWARVLVSAGLHQQSARRTQ